MAIYQFTKSEFEASLPIHKNTGEPLWAYAGLIKGEHCYTMDVNEVQIMIRSSVKESGFAASTGQDSIRLYFMNNGNCHGSKLSLYITRVTGWEERLLKQLRIMFKRGLALQTCSICNQPLALFKSKKTGDLFQTCPNHFMKVFIPYEGE